MMNDGIKIFSRATFPARAIKLVATFYKYPSLQKHFVCHSKLLASVLVIPSCHNGKLRSLFPRILYKAGFFPVVYHYNAALFLRSSTVITSDYCPGGHLPRINKAEERWRQVTTLTPTARLDVEESRFRSVGATVGWLALARP